MRRRRQKEEEREEMAGRYRKCRRGHRHGSVMKASARRESEGSWSFPNGCVSVSSAVAGAKGEPVTDERDAVVQKGPLSKRVGQFAASDGQMSLNMGQGPHATRRLPLA